MAGLEEQLGSLRKGSVANVLVTDGPLFESSTHLVEHYVGGNPTPMRDRHPLDLHRQLQRQRGRQRVRGDCQGRTWQVESVLDGERFHGGERAPLTLDNRTVVFRLATEEGPIRLTGNVWMESRIWEGSGQTATGEWTDWSAIRNAAAAEDPGN